ncbi:MAG: transglutaminase family protein, partial [Candidatus Gottesmanbacteria bacterium]|nr:transglutaminase family protein [Candidatus Gottesmanbacteria bacterium]
LLLVGLAAIVYPHTRVQAAGEFQADYNVQYAIAPSGLTIVTQNITLTNKRTNLYPQKYSIVIDSTKIKNVIAYDGHQIVPADISQHDGKTEILLTFNDKVVGLGRQLSFTLRFENGDITQQNGSIWEVNVPGVAPDADIASYYVSLSVPQAFGPNAYMTPLPASGGRWNREQMMAGGISAAYGASQTFDVHLSYYLENSGITPQHSEIALPPDTAYQTMVIESLDPKPTTVTQDTDGNWLAQYSLLPGARLSIEASLHINMLLEPKEGYVDDVPDQTLYTSTQKYWEANNPQIQALAKKYTTPREIYSYVSQALRYNEKRAAQAPIRKGAVLALNSADDSLCMEFTDLFIAITRAAGIPAREAIGYAYTTNSRLRPLSLIADVLHAWPEYYDGARKLWIPVDPTWANTTGGVNYFDKLDFNHIVFAIYGKSSDYPYPAGFYRKNGKTTKDVAVTFASSRFIQPVSKLNTAVSFPKLVTAGLAARGEVTVENTTGAAVPQVSVTIQSTPVDVGVAKTVPNVPPFGKLTYPLALTIPNYFKAGTGRLVIGVNGQTQQYVFNIQPITSYFIFPIICFSGILLILLMLTLRKTHLWKHRKKR